MRCDYKERHYAEIEFVFENAVYHPLFIRVCRKCIWRVQNEWMGYKIAAIYEMNNRNYVGYCVWLKGLEGIRGLKFEKDIYEHPRYEV